MIFTIKFPCQYQWQWFSDSHIYPSSYVDVGVMVFVVVLILSAHVELLLFLKHSGLHLDSQRVNHESMCKCMKIRFKMHAHSA